MEQAKPQRWQIGDVTITKFFEAPIGPHDWLNKSLFVSTIQPAKIDSQAAVIIRIYRIT